MKKHRWSIRYGPFEHAVIDYAILPVMALLAFRYTPRERQWIVLTAVVVYLALMVKRLVSSIANSQSNSSGRVELNRLMFCSLSVLACFLAVVVLCVYLAVGFWLSWKHIALVYLVLAFPAVLFSIVKTISDKQHRL